MMAKICPRVPPSQPCAWHAFVHHSKRVWNTETLLCCHSCQTVSFLFVNETHGNLDYSIQMCTAFKKAHSQLRKQASLSLYVIGQDNGGIGEDLVYLR